jgi:hypothetical protein
LHPLESLEPAECLVHLPALSGNKGLQWARERGLSTDQQYARCIDWSDRQGIVFHELGRIFRDDRTVLNNFEVVSLDANSHGSLDSVDGYDESVISGAGLKNSFDAIERATAKSHALANFEKRMTATRDVLSKKNSNWFDLFLGNCRALAILPDESDYAIDCQHLYSRLIGGDYLHEQVAGE